MNSKDKPLISIVSGCYNEEANIKELILRIKKVIDKIDKYDYEIIIIDNNSTDNTRNLLREACKIDEKVKVILNTRNFGHIRSPYYGMLQANGNAVIYLVSDLQEPPELITQFIKEWENGHKVVLGVKHGATKKNLFNKIRKAYYKLLQKISSLEIVEDSTGFGLYDKEIMHHIKEIKDPYPYFRGLVSELGYKPKLIKFDQIERVRGISKNNIYTLYDIGILGVISTSKFPLRISMFAGLLFGMLSIIVGILIFVLKILWSDLFAPGIATLGVVVSFLFGLQMIFIGIMGEYLGLIYNKLINRPIVTEEERINFNKDSK